MLDSVNGTADPPHRAGAILNAVAAGGAEISQSCEPDPTPLERTLTHAVGTITAKDGTEGWPGSRGVTLQGMELRHLRYLVAVADAGTFTRAAEQMFIAQPTLSQQIRRLEEMVGTPLLQRRREGLRLTEAGSVLLEESRALLSLVDQGVSRTRQAAGLGRARLRFVVPPSLPEDLAVDVASRLRCTAEAADVDVAWLERPLDAEFSLIQQRQADAGLGWSDHRSRGPARASGRHELGRVRTRGVDPGHPQCSLPRDHQPR